MNNMFISSAKKDEDVENFVKDKRAELEKMIPDFVDDRKFTDIVLNFYERGIRDCAQMMNSHPVSQWHKVSDRLPPKIKETAAISKAVDAEPIEVNVNITKASDDVVTISKEQFDKFLLYQEDYLRRQSMIQGFMTI